MNKQRNNFFSQTGAWVIDESEIKAFFFLMLHETTSNRVLGTNFCSFLTELELRDYKNLFWKMRSRSTVSSTHVCVISLTSSTSVFCYRSDGQALFYEQYISCKSLCLNFSVNRTPLSIAIIIELFLSRKYYKYLHLKLT